MTKYSDIHDELFEVPEPGQLPYGLRLCQYCGTPKVDGSIACYECLRRIDDESA